MTLMLMKIKYRKDKVLELRLDTTDFFIDGVRGWLPSKRHRDFLISVARRSPITSTFEMLESDTGHVNSHEDFKKIVSKIRGSLEKKGLVVPILESVRGVGYALADGWKVEEDELNSKHFAYELLSLLSVTLEKARNHVGRTTVITNVIGLSYVERTETTREIAKENYTVIENLAWQLIHVLSSCGITNDQYPEIIELKRQLERSISFALFWRLGDSMTDDKFRRDFIAETRALESDIELRVRRILSDGMTQRGRIAR